MATLLRPDPTLYPSARMASETGDSTQRGRTWVVLTEATEGGSGIAGTAYGREEFAAAGSASRTP